MFLFIFYINRVVDFINFLGEILASGMQVFIFFIYYPCPNSRFHSHFISAHYWESADVVWRNTRRLFRKVTVTNKLKGVQKENRKKNERCILIGENKNEAKTESAWMLLSIENIGGRTVNINPGRNKCRLSALINFISEANQASLIVKCEKGFCQDFLPFLEWHCDPKYLSDKWYRKWASTSVVVKTQCYR